MSSEYIGSVLSTPDISSERSESSGSKRRRRSAVRVACNACRTKKTRCDGRRPVCGWCASHPGVQCIYDTESSEETRSAALKRENEILRKNLERAERLLQDLTSSSDERSMELLKRLRVMGNSAAAPHSNSAYGYPVPSSSADNHLPNGTLRNFLPMPDGFDAEAMSHLDHESTAPTNQPSSHDVQSVNCPELGYCPPRLTPLVKKAPAEPIPVSVGFKRAAHGPAMDTR